MCLAGRVSTLQAPLGPPWQLFPALAVPRRAGWGTAELQALAPLLLALWLPRHPVLLLSFPGLGTNVRTTPSLLTGLKAEGRCPGLCLLFLASGVSNQSGPSNFLLPLLHWLRALSTVSLAQGSGRCGATAQRKRLSERCPGEACGVSWLCSRGGLQVGASRRCLQLMREW